MLKIRNINKAPGKISTYPNNQFNRVLTEDSTDIKIHSRDIKKSAAEQLQKRNKFINNSQGEPVYFYRRLEKGRRCSCTDGFSTPAADCPLCFKTGVVGGYLKYGTHQNIMEAFASNVSLINIHHSLEMQLRPLNFILDETALQGSIIFDFDVLQTNKRVVDKINFLYSGINRHASVSIFVKKPSESAYVVCNSKSIEDRLNEDILNFKINVVRSHPDVESPKISHFWLRYMILESCEIPLDIAPSTKSTTLDELGTIKNAQPVQAFFDSRLGTISSEDFIYRLEEHELWKPIDEEGKKSVGVRTSSDITLRVIQDFEPYSRFPL